MPLFRAALGNEFSADSPALTLLSSINGFEFICLRMSDLRRLMKITNRLSFMKFTLIGLANQRVLQSQTNPQNRYRDKYLNQSP